MALPVFVAFTIVSCAPARLMQSVADSAEAPFDPSRDYFPHKVTIRYASQFRVTYHKHYKVVEFDPTVPTREKIRYVLVQRGTPVPRGFAGAYVVQVPVRRYAMLHQTYLGVLEPLGLKEGLAAIANHRSVTIPWIREAYERKQIREAGVGTHANIEMTIGLNLDVVFLFYSAYPEYNLHPKLQELGQASAMLADQFEPSPLGRAEWIKFLSLFFNREREAEALFNPVAGRYEGLSRKANAIANRPTVMIGAPGSDSWMVSGNRNYFAQLLRDAGADSFWPGEEYHSLLQANYEMVFDRSLESAVWFTASGMYYPSIEVLLARDPRLAWFRPVERRQVFAFDRNADRQRRMPYSDQSLDKPDVLLADVLTVLHPELVAGHQRGFLRQVTEAQP